MRIKPEDSVERFRVSIDEKLTFEKHINKLFRSASCQINTVFWLKNFFKKIWDLEFPS